MNRELSYVHENVMTWKFLIIASHNALQAVMARALRQGNVANVFSDKSAKKFNEYLDEMVKVGDDESKRAALIQPKGHMLNLMSLYERIQNSKYLNDPYDAMGNRYQIVRLNDFRNEFIHFKWSGWSISVEPFPQIIDEVLRVIKYLSNTHNGSFFVSRDDLNHINELTNAISIKNTEVKDKYKLDN